MLVDHLVELTGKEKKVNKEKKLSQVSFILIRVKRTRSERASCASIVLCT